VTPRGALWQIFAVPLFLGALSLAGLVAALLIEGPADLAAALAAGCGLLVVPWVWFVRRR